jgi:hypothetical protein
VLASFVCFTLRRSASLCNLQSNTERATHVQAYHLLASDHAPFRETLCEAQRLAHGNRVRKSIKGEGCGSGKKAERGWLIALLNQMYTTCCHHAGLCLNACKCYNDDQTYAQVVGTDASTTPTTVWSSFLPFNLPCSLPYTWQLSC